MPPLRHPKRRDHRALSGDVAHPTRRTAEGAARAELLVAAGFGQEARGRPIHGRLESEDDGDGEPGPRVKIGAVRPRRLGASEGSARLSASAYGNPVRGTRDIASAAAVGAPVIARVDVPDARGWRVYRAAANGAVIYDGWIEHEPAHAEPVVAELRAAAAASPEAALRAAVGRQPGHASADAIARLARRPGDRAAGHRGEAPVAGGTAAVAARPRGRGGHP